MTTAKQDGTIVTEIESETETSKAEIGTIEKDEFNDVWVATCSLCSKGFAELKKADTVDAVETHFQQAHVTP